jgi:DNA polymerase
VTDPRTLLAELGARAAVCTACELANTRTTVVFADGSPDADLMFVGEARA